MFEVPESEVPFVSPLWQDNYVNLCEEIDFLDDGSALPLDFMVKLWYRGGYFMHDLAVAKAEWEVCCQWFGEEGAYDLCRETTAFPRVIRDWFHCDLTTVHHMFHVAMWEKTTSNKIADLRSIVEWGAGFGSLARICLRLNPDLLYFTIDLPLLNEASETYLRYSRIPGRDLYNHIAVTPSQSSGLQADLFIATWSLDESTKYAQQWVVEHNYFDAEHILLAYHPNKGDFPDSNISIPMDCVVRDAMVAESYYALR